MHIRSVIGIKQFIQHHVVIACGVGLTVLSPMLMAQPLNVAQNKLELTASVKNNLFYLLDNSGSMDFEIFTSDYLSSGLLLSAQPNGDDLSSADVDRQIIHRIGCEQEATLFGGYAYGVASPTNVYAAASGNHCYVAAATSWRFRNAEFNPLYFNPDLQYEPWPGFDANGNSFSDYRQRIIQDSFLVPLDAYDPSSGLVDLMADNPVTGQFRYYDWTDDGDGEFENGEQTEHLFSTLTPQAKGNFANWFVYHRSRFLRAKGAIAHSVIQPEITRAGFAVTQSSSDANNFQIMELGSDPSTGNKRQFLKALYAVQIGPLVNVFPGDTTKILNDNNVFPDQFNVGTPLRIRLDQARQYLSCNVSSGVEALFDSSSCPVFGLADGGSCQTHQLFLVSDGFYNGIRPAPGGNEDASTGGTGLVASAGLSAFDGGAFADSVSQSLADQAMRAYKIDFAAGSQGIANELIPVPEDILRYPRSGAIVKSDRLHQHIKTHVLGFGGKPIVTPADPVEAFSWNPPSASNQGILEELFHTAYNGRGKLLLLDQAQASNTDAAGHVRNVIQNNAIPGDRPITTQAVVSNGIVYQTLFDPLENSGDILAFSIQANGNVTETPDWSAALHLDSKIAADDDSRNLYTYVDDGSASTGGRLFQSSGSGVSAEQLALLNHPLPANVKQIATQRLDYLRGQYANEGSQFDDGEFRQRPQVAGKMGPIENSVPVLVGSPSGRGRSDGAWPAGENVYFNFQRDHADRDPVLYVGSNSGIFHAIDAGTGAEQFGYVPNLVFAQLSLLSLPEYRHQYFVDGTATVNDIFMRSGSTLTWRTVLVSGLGAGGRGYFALDVTTPGSFTTDSVLWEFSAQDDPVPGLNGAVGSHLGLSLGAAQMIMSNAAHFSNNEEKQWAAVFGNGVNNTSADGNAVVFIVFIDDLDANNKPRMIKIDTGVGYDAEFDTPNGIIEVRAADVDGNGTADRLYAGDLQGNLFAIDISDENPGQWNSTPKIIFTASLDGGNALNDRQPITSRPILLPHPTGNGLLISFSTGTYFLTEDAIDDSVQSIYGIWDDFSGNEIRFDDLVEQEFTNRQNPVDTAVSDIPVVRTITDYPVNWGQGDKGWYINLDVASVTGNESASLGERVIGKPVLLGGNLFLNTNLPATGVCSSGGGGFNLAVNPFTGGEPVDVVFDTNNDGEFDSQDSIQTVDSLEVIAGTRNDSAIRSTVFYDGNLGVVNQSGRLTSVGINVRDDRYLGRRSWREIEDYEE